MSIGRAAEAIEGAGSIAITTHIGPDGDGVGAALALDRALRALGKRVTLRFPSVVAAHLDFLPGYDRIRALEDEAAARRAKPVDLLVSVDCGDLERLGAVRHLRRGALLNIDHHVSNDRFGDRNLVDAKAACTTMIIHRLLVRLDAAIDVPIAECLYTGLVFDTGRFMHSNTDAAVFRFAARLLGYGIDAAAINRKLTYTLSPQLLQAQRLGIERMEVDRSEPRVAGFGFSAADIAGLGEIDDWGELIEIPRSLRGVEVAWFLREQPDRKSVRCSLRSNPPYAVGPVAKTLGGGGHAQAAGCTVPGDLASVRRKLLPMLRNCLG